MTFQSNPNIQPFNVSAVGLLAAVDSISERAMQGVQRAAEAISTLPADVHPILRELMNHFQAIGHVADSTVAGSGVDLAEVWGVAG